MISAKGEHLPEGGAGQGGLLETVPRDRPLPGWSRPRQIVGHSPPLAMALERARIAASCDAPVVVLGPRGAGRTTLATEIHVLSARRHRPVVHFSALDLPPAVVSAALLDSASGADGEDERPPVVRSASGSTVVIDVPRRLPQTLQNRVLRLVLGRASGAAPGADPQAAAPRWVLVAESENGGGPGNGGGDGGRDSLVSRLACDRRVFVITLPSLRERAEDILPLARYFLACAGARSGRTFTGFSRDAQRLLVEQEWLGNVRQLERTIDCAAAVAIHDELDVQDAEHGMALAAAPAGTGEDLVTLRENERRYLCRVLAETRWNRSRASRVLGIPRMSLYNKMKRFGIVPDAAARK